MLVIRAVSSPQTKAPDPLRISRSKSNPVPRMFWPRNPHSRAWAMAMPRRSMASGYSARTYTKPWWAPMAYPAMAIASMTLWGSPSRTDRSMKAPGSPSSALQRTYFTSPGVFRAKAHFRPVGKPPPPRPRRPEAFTSSTTCSGVIRVRAFARAAYPSRAT
jgi:hypothetical protein